LLSHTGIVESAVEHRYRRILVLEDDVLFHQDFIGEFQKVRRLPSDWKLLYLGASQHKWRTVRRRSPMVGSAAGWWHVATAQRCRGRDENRR
jgi:GR25 family glycosyltransferase involved in LPS biosynthesis